MIFCSLNFSWPSKNHGINVVNNPSSDFHMYMICAKILEWLCALRKVRIYICVRKVGVLTLRRTILRRMVSAQSRKMDQVRLVMILLYPLLGQKLNLTLNLFGRLFD